LSLFSFSTIFFLSFGLGGRVAFTAYIHILCTYRYLAFLVSSTSVHPSVHLPSSIYTYVHL
jgi:hypothetical protein